jgi:hypothetical protein
VSLNRDYLNLRETIVRRHVDTARSELREFNSQRAAAQTSVADLLHDLPASAGGDEYGIPVYAVKITDRNAGRARWQVVGPSRVTKTSSAGDTANLSELTEFRPYMEAVGRAVAAASSLEDLYDDGRVIQESLGDLDITEEAGGLRGAAARIMKGLLTDRKVRFLDERAGKKGAALRVDTAPISTVAPARETRHREQAPVVETDSGPDGVAEDEAGPPSDIRRAYELMVQGEYEPAVAILDAMIAAGDHVPEAKEYLELCRVMMEDKTGGSADRGDQP